MAAVLMALGTALAGCAAGQGTEQLAPLWSHMWGPAFEGREPPPNTDAVFPNLGTVPPRPAVPDVAVREALTAALAEERQRSRNPLEPEMRPTEPRPAGTEGDRSMPMRAPGPPPLARAPRIPWEQVDPAAPAVQPAPAAPPAQRPGPTPPPAMDSAPPPPPPAELLDPSGPPPLPSQDLLRPRNP